MRIEVRGDNVTVSGETVQIIDRKTRLALGRFAAAISSVRVVVRDLNGPKQGVDQSCSIKVKLNRGGEVHVGAEDPVRWDAIDRALDRASRSTGRLLARQQRFARQALRLIPADGPGANGYSS
jgi:putative sigma-54 modulation protein